ncbi:MAG: MFS transporter, partial [Xanthobacteraceae bacterium]|nr:MFS transporter [Xanthobacteraceae bacterium]
MFRTRIVPLIVAVALFMENMDSTIISTALPAIARDIGTNPLALKLAITSYLLALAIFIPASGWTADRFGARNVFRAAIAIFMVGSIGCAMAHSLGDFVIARFIQGMGGAMMSPVGRLVMLRSFDKREIVSVMTWVTMPALIGPILGPPVGGFITTYFTWHWIFVINIPIGLLGIALATQFIPDMRGDERVPFDFVGFALAGIGIGGLAFGLTTAGVNYFPTSVVAALVTVGTISTIAYVRHSNRTPAPLLDLSLFKLQTFRASVLGGFVFRIGVGALPFLLPLLLQLGFNMTPFESGLITFSTALGAMSMKAVVPYILRQYGFRTTLVVNAVLSAAFLGACAAFRPGTPV